METLGEFLKKVLTLEAYNMKEETLLIFPNDETRKKIAGNIESTDSSNAGTKCSCTACGSCRCTPCK